MASTGGIPTTTSVSDRREEGSGISRGRPNAGKRSPATTAAARQGDDQREEPKARRGWWEGIKIDCPKGILLAPTGAIGNAQAQTNRGGDSVVALERACPSKRSANETDPAKNPCGRGLPGRQQCLDAGGGSTAAYRRDTMGPETVYEYGSTQGIETRTVG